MVGALVAKLTGSELAQFRVHQRHQPVESLVVPIGHPVEDLGHLGWLGGHEDKDTS